MKNKTGKFLLLLFFTALFLSGSILPIRAAGETAGEKKKPIRYVEFNITAAALSDAAEADIASHRGEKPIGWVELLACLGQQYGGDFSKYKKAHLTALLKELQEKTPEETVKNKKLYRYYLEAYGAVLSGLLGPYTKEWEEDGVTHREESYGVRAFSPIAAGYSYSHYDDFGAARSFGYRRSHLGHDILGSIGTPIIATEGGIVEAIGWNRYGGWRIGIRSLDGKRYYYYAHLRRGHPYADLYEGQIVAAGEVIGYLGMTGYSDREDSNNINVPHLHYGIELIFDPAQKDGTNQIWIDCYELIRFLDKYRSKTSLREDGKERVSSFRYLIPETPEQ